MTEIDKKIEQAIETGDASNLDMQETVTLLERLKNVAKDAWKEESVNAPELSDKPVERSKVVSLLVSMAPHTKLQAGGTVLSLGAGGAGTAFLLSEGTPVGWALLPVLGGFATVVAGNMLFNYKPERDDKYIQETTRFAYKVTHPIDTFTHWKARRRIEKQEQKLGKDATEKVNSIAQDIADGIRYALEEEPLSVTT